MKKIKLQIGKGISKSWISSFLSNVLGVIVGIVITFGVSYLIQRHNEKQDTKGMMTLIKDELEENKQWIKLRKKEYENNFNAYQKILIAKDTGNLRNIPADTLVEWITQTRIKIMYFVGANAWDIFKNSGTIAKFHNKYLILVLSECYHYIDKASESMDRYNNKKETASNIYLNYKISPYEYIDVLLANEESKSFLISVIELNEYEIKEMFTFCDNLIDYTLYLIEKDENSDENILHFDSFREQKDNEAVKTK
jgi:hypothetical protein